MNTKCPKLKEVDDEYAEVFKKGDEINFLEIYNVFMKGKKYLFYSVTFFAVLSTLYCFVSRPVYRSESQLLIPAEDQSTIGSLLSQTGIAGSFIGGNSGGKSELYISLLTSRRVAERLIDRFSLEEIYRCDGSPRQHEKLIGEIQKSIIAVCPSSSVMTLSFDTYSPELARSAAVELIQYTNKLLNELNVEKASEKRLFLMKRIEEVSAEIKLKRAQLEDFYTKNGICHVETQAKETIQTSSELYRKMVDLQTTLKIQKMSIGENNPEYIANETGYQDLKNRYMALYNTVDNKYNEPNIYIPIGKIPNLTFNDLELRRNLDGQVEILKFLTQQYELAKIDEKKSDLFLRILDPPSLPANKIKPKVLITVLFSVFIGLFVGVCIIIVKYITASASNET